MPEIINDKHKIFIAEYVKNNCNATKAYMVAYGCNYEVAKANASRLLTDVNIKALIKAEVEKYLDDTSELTVKVINEYKKLAFSDISEFIDPATGESRITPETDTAPLESVVFKESKYGTDRHYKMHSKLSALDALSKYVIGFTEKKEITVSKLDEFIESLKKV